MMVCQVQSTRAFAGIDCALCQVQGVLSIFLGRAPGDAVPCTWLRQHVCAES